MVASMLVMAISFTWDGGQHVGDGHQFYLGGWPACWCWPSVCPGMVASMPVLAISLPGMVANMMVMAISLPGMVASMLVMAVSLPGMVASMLVMAVSLPGMVASTLVLAISFTWEGGQHVGDGHQFYLGWWPACW